MKKVFKAKKHHFVLLAILIGGLIIACCWPTIEGLADGTPAPTAPTKDDKDKLQALASQVSQIIGGLKQ